MKPIKELLEDQTCDDIDRWIAECPDGSTRSAQVSFCNMFDKYAVDVWIVEQDRAENWVRSSGGAAAPTAREAFAKAVEKFLSNVDAGEEPKQERA
jgi:hypothetical protein